MPRLRQLFIVALFTVLPSVAQQAPEDADAPEQTTGAATSSVASEGRESSEPQSSPALRDEFEPRDRISRDKAEAFPPDI